MTYLWGHNVSGDHHDLLCLCTSLRLLRNMHIHLVAVKVSIVWTGDRQVEPEGGIGQQAHTMTLRGATRDFCTMSKDRVEVSCGNLAHPS